jgi:hypothetical protein
VLIALPVLIAVGLLLHFHVLSYRTNCPPSGGWLDCA